MVGRVWFVPTPVTSSPGRSRNASTGVLGRRRCNVAESITLTAAGVLKTSFSVRVAVTVTCPSDVTRLRAESERDAESLGLGDWAASMLEVNRPSTAIERDVADVTDMLEALRRRGILPYVSGFPRGIRHGTE
jgi:hypothetical protein